MKHPRLIAIATLAGVGLIILTASLALAGKKCGAGTEAASVAAKGCWAGAVANVEAKACGAGQVAAVEPKACGTKAVAAIEPKACGASPVAAAETRKACGTGAAMASGLLASVDGQNEAKAHEAKADHAKACTNCHAAGECKSKSTCAKSAHGKLSAVMTKLDEAEKAVKAGDKDAALAALAEVRSGLEPMHKRMAAHAADAGEAKAKGHHAMKHQATDHAAKADKPAEAQSAYANSKCPIMGSPIKADAVPASLVREFDGQKVAFCCGGCPRAWDKLTAEEKKAKLAASK
jgi:hypothetical protein